MDRKPLLNAQNKAVPRRWQLALSGAALMASVTAALILSQGSSFSNLVLSSAASTGVRQSVMTPSGHHMQPGMQAAATHKLGQMEYHGKLADNAPEAEPMVPTLLMSKTPSWSLLTGLSSLAFLVLASLALQQRLQQGHENERWLFTATGATSQPMEQANSASKGEIQRTPITILSGFLGSGKTTTLKHLLENREGLRVGVIVNDVAAVNIDAQLIQNSGIIDGLDTVQLQNGCACCSIQNELLESVEQLLAQGRFDHIVIELSGVAEPARVQETVNFAEEQGNAIAATLKTKNIVTVVDASTFGELCISQDRFKQRKELGAEATSMAEENVATLLVEQIECANLILLNKVDTTSAEEVALIKEYITALNKDAKIIITEFGRVQPRVLLEGTSVKKAETDHDHEHAHDHGHAHDHEDAHDHEHSAAHAHDCQDAACTDPSHNHDHDHDHNHDHHHGHDHDHDHEHNHDHSCNDPTCTDPSHVHDNHQHTPSDTNLAKKRFGIDTFVYQARRPFDTTRLLALVDSWPVPTKSLLKDHVFSLAEAKTTASTSLQHPLAPVLRSKGFVWVTTNPRLRVEWIHAGKHFTMTDSGPWWANFTDEELRRLHKPAEYEDIMNNQYQGKFGDRRNELVFIGVGMDTAYIKSELDKCLLSDEEMSQFEKLLALMSQPLGA